MERYSWRDGKIRLRLKERELMDRGISRDGLIRFDADTKRKLTALITEIQHRGELPDGELFAEIFPGKSGVVIQIAPEKNGFFLSGTDEMLAVFPLVKKMGAALYRRLDGKGFYLAHFPAEARSVLIEFAAPCIVRDGMLRERCKRII